MSDKLITGRPTGNLPGPLPPGTRPTAPIVPATKPAPGYAPESYTPRSGAAPLPDDALMSYLGPDGDAAAFLGRTDLLEAANEEKHRLFGDKPTLTLEQFAFGAHITQMTTGQLALAFKNATGGQPEMTGAQFDKLYAACVMNNDAYRTLERRPMGTESTSPARQIDDRMATADLAKLDPQVASVVAGLSAADQARYASVEALSKGDPQAQRALETLVASGRLTPGLLDALSGLATTPFAPELDHATVLRDVLEELVDPVRIFQGNFGTCAATTSQMLLASHRPESYVRVMTGLASEAGQAKLPTGASLERVPATLTKAPREDRSTTSRLFQSAAMQFGHEAPYDYLGAAADKQNGGLGLSPLEREHLLHNLLGGKTNFVTQLQGPGTVAEQAAVMQQLAGASPLSPISVGICWGKDGTGAANHVVLVTGVSGDKVSITNPDGDQELLTRGEFLKRFREAVLVGEGQTQQVTGRARDARPRALGSRQPL